MESAHTARVWIAKYGDQILLQDCFRNSSTVAWPLEPAAMAFLSIKSTSEIRQKINANNESNFTDGPGPWSDEAAVQFNDLKHGPPRFPPSQEVMYSHYPTLPHLVT